MNALLADPATEALRLDHEAKNRTAQDAWKEFSTRRDAFTNDGGDPMKDAAGFTELKGFHQTYEEAAKAAEQAKDAYIKHLEAEQRGSKELLPGAMPDNISKSLIEAMGEKAFDVTSGGTATSQFYDPVLRTLPARQMFTRTILPTTSIDTDKFDYLRQTVATHNAAETAPGALKPTSVYSLERVEDRCRTVAHLSEPVQRQALLDLDNMRSFVDGQLRLGVLLREEAQILNGDAAGENLRGILQTAGILSQARGTDAHADAVFKAMTALISQANPYYPNAVVLNPADWQDIRITRNANGDYQLGNGVEDNPPRLFGLEVITSPVLAAGTGLVGDFNQARIYDREQARIDWAESGALGAGGVEIFSRNLLVARGEERIGFAVERPAAFCQVTGL